jgi:hypothetical protein
MGSPQSPRSRKTLVVQTQKLEKMACDKNIRFGRGLCIAWELIKDNNVYINEI